MNNRGFVGDIMSILVVLFVLVVTVMAAYFAFSAVNDSFQGSSLSNQTKEIVGDSKARYVGVWDGIALVVFGLLAIALVMSVAALGTRPEFFFILLIVGVVLVGIAAIFANTYEAVTGTELSGTSSEFTFIPLLMDNLVNVVLLLFFLLVIGMFVKLGGVV